jgi:hypothetical protein
MQGSVARPRALPAALARATGLAPRYIRLDTSGGPAGAEAADPLPGASGQRGRAHFCP